MSFLNYSSLQNSSSSELNFSTSTFSTSNFKQSKIFQVSQKYLTLKENSNLFYTVLSTPILFFIIFNNANIIKDQNKKNQNYTTFPNLIKKTVIKIIDII